MAKRRLRLASPTTVNRTVRPRRPHNADLRTREYLTEAAALPLFATGLGALGLVGWRRKRKAAAVA